MRFRVKAEWVFATYATAAQKVSQLLEEGLAEVVSILPEEEE